MHCVVVLLSLLCSSVVFGETPVILKDNTNYFKGYWTGYLSPFNKGLFYLKKINNNLILNKTKSYVAYTKINKQKGNAVYAQDITLYPSTFPNNSTWTWSWPDEPDNDIHITGYNGNYNNYFDKFLKNN